MRTGTVAILFIVILAVGLMTEVDAGCSSCRYKCSRRGCRWYICIRILFKTICKCKSCAVESPLLESPMTKVPQWSSTGLGMDEDLHQDDHIINDEINLGQ